VLGAGGKLGKEVVLSLLRKGGYGVRAAARGALTTADLGSPDFPADDVDVLTGVDVTKPETLQDAVASAGAVVVCSRSFLQDPMPNPQPPKPKPQTPKPHSLQPNPLLLISLTPDPRPQTLCHNEI
jgi:hypothetical protein